MQAIYVDIGPLLEDQWTGIPVFTRRLIDALGQSPRLSTRFCFELHEVPSGLVRRAVAHRSGTLLRGELFRDDSAFLTVCDPAVPVLYPTAKHIITSKGITASTVHDMSTLVMPEFHKAENVAHHLDYFRDELVTDDAVFCASDSTRNALISAYPFVEDKARILYQYVDWPAEFELMDHNAGHLRLGRYALVIGTLEPRKNLSLLLKALQDERLAQLSLTFLVVGRKGWLIDEILASVTPEQRDRIVFTGFVSEFVKYRLIKNCEFLLFPSVYEGFGIPAVEALSLGRPVVASFASCFPEVIGEAGLYFDPFSVQALVDAIEQALDVSSDARMKAMAIERSRYFSAERMAAPVLDWLGAS
ncbi:Glycosyltransferase involved in cell wall bisynthesis [Methylobacterium sp. 174MFSha1.1]|uniref:glycosyltransferase family 4 protein n=1 Tax=Methylobacterium sp. 174MFSha1.1 TaxID=1502749 RepID=UPI0008F07CB8|nr:glycosyltransferase family 1 protein [Methylobacterium sp. 174MFSha1.1]SFU46737.1 Glycosyltransferase involved in cell wall bisynthesis [Methylobacterium sp. 174MFSha1.1]